MNIDIILRALGADAVANSLQQVASGANAAGAAASNAAGGANELGDGLDAAGQAAEAAKSKFEGIRNAGVGIAAAGAAALVLSANLRQVAAEGADAQKKMEDMFAKRGEGGRVEELSDWAGDLSKQAAMVDDDPIKEAAAQLAGFGVNADQVKGIMPGLIGQSRLYNQSLESVASAFGKAFASGNAGALKKSGVTLDQADIDKLKDIEDPVQKQKMLFDMVKKSMDQYALGMREGMSDATIQANLLANEMDSLYGGMGEGAAMVHTAITAHLLLPLLHVANASPGIQHAAGAILEIGGSAASVVGTLMGFVGQVGMANLGLQAMGLSGIGAFKGMMTSALAAAPAMWAAMAPVLGVLLAIVAASLLVAAALYKITGAYDAVEQAKKDSAQADAADKAFYDQQKAKGKIKVSFEDWQKQMGRGEENSEDASAPKVTAEADMSGIEKKLADIKNGASTPSLSIPVPASTSAVMDTATDESEDDDEAEVSDDGTKSGHKAAEKAAKDAKRAAEKAAKASARKAEKDKKEAEKAADKAEDAARDAKGYALDVSKARSDDKFDSDIERLEDLLDKAKDDANLTKVKALTLELATAKAKKARADREIDIAQTALTNAAKAASMKSISDIEFAGDMRRAQRESRNANIDGSKGADDKRDAGLRAEVAQKMLRGGGIGGGFSFAALNPAGSARVAGMTAGATSTAKLGAMTQNGDGSMTVKFEEITFPYSGIGGL